LHKWSKNFTFILFLILNT